MPPSGGAEAERRCAAVVLEECLEFIGVLDWLPHTLCHGDANPYNLFAREGPDDRHQTVAIDWAFTGIGVLGEELATLLRSDTRENATYEELDQAIFSGYLEGLHDVGWLGDSRLARIGYTTAAALRYGLNAWPVNVIVDPLSRTQVEQAFGVTIEAFLDWAARIRHQALLLADESRMLRGDLQEESKSNMVQIGCVTMWFVGAPASRPIRFT